MFLFFDYMGFQRNIIINLCVILYLIPMKIQKEELTYESYIQHYRNPIEQIIKLNIMLKQLYETVVF